MDTPPAPEELQSARSGRGKYKELYYKAGMLQKKYMVAELKKLLVLHNRERWSKKGSERRLHLCWYL